MNSFSDYKPQHVPKAIKIDHEMSFKDKIEWDATQLKEKMSRAVVLLQKSNNVNYREITKKRIDYTKIHTWDTDLGLLMAKTIVDFENDALREIDGNLKRLKMFVDEKMKVLVAASNLLHKYRSRKFSYTTFLFSLIIIIYIKITFMKRLSPSKKWRSYQNVKKRLTIEERIELTNV